MGRSLETTGVLAGLLLGAAAMAAPRPAAATVAGDLCTGDPCVISGKNTIDPVSLLDFGPTTVVRLAPKAQLVLGTPSDPDMDVQILAGTVILEPKSEIRGRQGTLQVSAQSGNLEIQSGARLNFLSLPGSSTTDPNGIASITLGAAGDVLLDGDIDAIHHSFRAFVEVGVTAGGAVRGGGTVDLRNTGSNEPVGGELAVQAQDDIELPGRLLAAGGYRGGRVDLQSVNGSITVGRIEVPGTHLTAYFTGAYGGHIDMQAAGDVTVLGRMIAKGKAGTYAQSYGTGLGGDVDIDAGGSISLGDKVDARGGLASEGGFFTADAGGDFTMASRSYIRVGSRFGVNGDAIIRAGGSALITSIRQSEFDSRGGVMRIEAGGSLTVTKEVRTKCEEAADAQLSACGPLVVERRATVDTSYQPGAPPIGGFSGGDAVLTGDGITVDGKLKAKDGANLLRWISTPPVVTGKIDPAPTITQVGPPAFCPSSPSGAFLEGPLFY